MELFRDDNTQGYASAELVELNAAWTQITIHAALAEDDDDMGVKSMLDNWSETLLAEYDSGKRGESLVAWFCGP